MGMQPKAIVEEFDPTWGRMNATLGAEMPNTNANVQTTVPFGYAEPATEVLDPHQVGAQIGTLGDGTQIWKITHNGVDSHPVHFHLFDVQLVNRVGWDGAKSAPEPGEVGWKDTVLMHPLEDTVVALRPQIPVLPFKLPDSIRPIDPSMPVGSPISTFDPLTGQAVTVPNTVKDYGWEYVWHCHMLSHEEMDFMRPIVVNAAPPTPTGLTTQPGSPQATKVGLAWTQPGSGNPVVSNWTLQRATDAAFTAGLQTMNVTPASPTFLDSGVTRSTTYFYRLRSESKSGYSSWSSTYTVKTAAFDTPATPTGLKASYTVARGQGTVTLSWTNAAAYTSVAVQRATNVAFTTGADGHRPSGKGGAASNLGGHQRDVGGDLLLPGRRHVEHQLGVLHAGRGHRDGRCFRTADGAPGHAGPDGRHRDEDHRPRHPEAGHPGDRADRQLRGAGQSHRELLRSDVEVGDRGTGHDRLHRLRPAGGDDVLPAGGRGEHGRDVGLVDRGPGAHSALTHPLDRSGRARDVPARPDPLPPYAHDHDPVPRGRSMKTIIRQPARLLLVAAALVAAAAHVPVIGPHLEEAPYMGVLFILLTTACLLLAGVSLTSSHPAGPTLAGLVCGAAIVGYAATRLVAFPQLADDVGNWLEPLGVVAVVSEGVVVGAAVRLLTSGRNTAAPASPITRNDVGPAAARR